MVDDIKSKDELEDVEFLPQTTFNTDDMSIVYEDGE